MAWSPISNDVPQYVDTNGDPYSGAVLKAYEAGTSTPTNFATNSGGGTTVASIALNADGYPEVSSNIVIPHIDQSYKLALYPTQTAADANSGAIWTVDSIYLGVSQEYDTVALMEAATGITAGQSVTTKGYTTAGDGGGALYLVVSAQAFDGYGDHELSNGNIAVLQHNGLLLASQFGCTGTSDTVNAQAMIDYADVLVTAGEEITIDFDNVVEITDTITCQVNSQRIPNIRCSGLIEYNGTNDRSAVVIGETAEKIKYAQIELAIENTNQSDWTNDSCVGILLKNLNTCENVHIRRVVGFTNGLVTEGDGTGFAYNTVNLGYFVNNKRGHQLLGSTGGWCNENLFLAGRFGVDTGVNNTKERIAVQFKKVGAYSLNNNLFIKPSFELNDADATDLTVGADFIGAITNHIVDCRDEGTAIIGRFDADSGENAIEIGYSGGASLGVEDSGAAGNIVVDSRQRHQINSSLIFNVPNLIDIYGQNGDATAVDRLSGMQIASISAGTLATSTTGATLGTDDITFAGSGAIGVVVDTVNAKQFTLAVGSTADKGGRLFVLCFDSGGSLLEGTSPYYAVGASNATLSVSGKGYLTGVDSIKNRTVRFHADVKSAFIGAYKGTADLQINSFRLFAQNDVNGLAHTMVLPTEASKRLSGSVRYANSAPIAGTWKVGDMFFHTTPAAAGNIGFVCITAGTPGTWKTFGTIAS